jgi:hypothetical protein
VDRAGQRKGNIVHARLREVKNWPYVPHELQKLWGRLGLEARLAVYITAKRMFDEPDDESPAAHTRPAPN